MLSTQPPTAHKLQPQDRVFMKPFKNAYFEACELWMLAKYEIAAIVSEGFTRVARLDIAKFQCTGILPFNSNVYTDLNFLPSAVTDMPIQSVIEGSVCNNADLDAL